MPSAQYSAATKVASAYRTGDPERIALARRELAEANITAAIQRSLEKAPPLTPAQVKRLTGLLRGQK